MSKNSAKNTYQPKFKFAFFHIKYWPTWLTAGLLIVTSLLPHRVRLKLATLLARLALKRDCGAYQRARINLTMCFPEKSNTEKEALLLKSQITAALYLMSMATLSLRGRNWLEKNTVIRGEEHLFAQTRPGSNTILLSPHTWALDISATLLTAKGYPVAAMAKKQKNTLLNWLIHRQRTRYGGIIHERSDGVQPFVRSVRKGLLGYYLADEDLGPEHSVFVPFFATQKATLAGLGRLAKISRANVLPVMTSYNTETGKYEIEFKPALAPFPLETVEQDSRLMNACMEEFIQYRPEQYMWILRLLKTRPNGELNPYKLNFS